MSNALKKLGEAELEREKKMAAFYFDDFIDTAV